jgi:hypothetical protein
VDGPFFSVWPIEWRIRSLPMISINNTTDSVSAGVKFYGYGPCTNAGFPFFFYEGFLRLGPDH